jgi:hypothetical protein
LTGGEPARVASSRARCVPIAFADGRNALAYVLRNAIHHRILFAGVDPCSSGSWFDGWREPVARTNALAASPLPAPRMRLLERGWRRLGLIDLGPTRR